MSGTDNTPNYYELLGVEPGSSVEEIRLAYKELARLYHPDSNFYGEIVGEQDPGLTAKQVETFKLLTAAYHTLVNEVRRSEYDQTLPPKLREWEDEREDFHRPLVDPVSGSMRVADAWGVFGNSGKVNLSELDKALEEDSNAAARGIFAKLLAFLKF